MVLLLWRRCPSGCWRRASCLPAHSIRGGGGGRGGIWWRGRTAGCGMLRSCRRQRGARRGCSPQGGLRGRHRKSGGGRGGAGRAWRLRRRCREELGWPHRHGAARCGTRDPRPLHWLPQGNRRGAVGGSGECKADLRLGGAAGQGPAAASWPSGGAGRRCVAAAVCAAAGRPLSPSSRTANCCTADCGLCPAAAPHAMARAPAQRRGGESRCSRPDRLQNGVLTRRGSTAGVADTHKRPACAKAVLQTAWLAAQAV